MTPEMKERVLATVNELIDCEPGCDNCCCHDEVCVCEPDNEPGPFDDDGDQDFLFEIARDKRYFE